LSGFSFGPSEGRSVQQKKQTSLKRAAIIFEKKTTGPVAKTFGLHTMAASPRDPKETRASNHFAPGGRPYVFTKSGAKDTRPRICAGGSSSGDEVESGPTDSKTWGGGKRPVQTTGWRWLGIRKSPKRAQNNKQNYVDRPPEQDDRGAVRAFAAYSRGGGALAPAGGIKTPGKGLHFFSNNGKGKSAKHFFLVGRARHRVGAALPLWGRHWANPGDPRNCFAWPRRGV